MKTSQKAIQLEKRKGRIYIRLEAREVDRSPAEMLLDAKTNRVDPNGGGGSEQNHICGLKDHSGCSMQKGWEGRQEGCDGS